MLRVSTRMCNSKLKMLMKSFILSQFSYCPLLWMFHSKTINLRINRIQEIAFRLAYNDQFSSSESLREQDKSVTINTRNLQFHSIEMYKIVNCFTPPILSNLLPSNYNTRDLRSKHSFQRYNETISSWGPKILEFVPNHINLLMNLSFRLGMEVCGMCLPYL